MRFFKTYSRIREGFETAELLLNELQEGLSFTDAISVIQYHQDWQINSHVTNGSIHQKAITWMRQIENNSFASDIGASLVRSHTGLQLDNIGLSISHSLTLDCVTWLLGHHSLFGDVLVLQLNYCIEAILFDDLSLYVHAPQGVKQNTSLASFWYIFTANIQFTVDFESLLDNYLISSPKFAGINFSYHSPFHTIAFGHGGLLHYHMLGYELRAKAHVLKDHMWFQPAHLFPAIIAEASEFSPTGKFLELGTELPQFYCKVGDFYNAANTTHNRLVDLACLASSSPYSKSVRRKLQLDESRIKGLWVGLTSGNRQLVNELDIVLNTVEALVKHNGINVVFIDGWTASSANLERDDILQEAPEGYRGHSLEVQNYEKAIKERWPDLSVKSLLGLPYEYKVCVGLFCRFSLTSAYTSSIIPSRVCGVAGVVHSSNTGREFIDMHIYKNSEFAPEYITTDILETDSSIDPLNTNYALDPDGYSEWLEGVLLRRQQLIGK
jgi:hypothetical protein